MSRELKFRAWDKLNKRMFPVYGLGQTWVTEDTFDGTDNGTNHFEGQEFLDRIVIMQFTGLYDIFEGDILQWKHSGGVRKGIVHFDKDTLTYWCNDKTLADLKFDCPVIIGNIHQNPELVEVIK
jgi:hypothetical protein